MDIFDSLLDMINFKKLSHEKLVKLLKKKNWLKKSLKFLNEILKLELNSGSDNSDNSNSSEEEEEEEEESGSETSTESDSD
jgi:hypothetical protein